MALIPYESANAALFEACVKLYALVRNNVYRETRPKLKLDSIIEDDNWRYQHMPVELREASTVTKKQLARLVKWKITHGVNRPFLPGMVDKNTEDDVENFTSKAAILMQKAPLDANAKDFVTTVERALQEVCNLKGVGPATGTLLLSIMRPDDVPFFEDELFHWLVPEHTAKLKYDKKEYKQLLDRAVNIMTSHGVKAQDLEKSAYVLVHANHLPDDKRRSLEKLCGASSNAQSAQPVGAGGDKASIEVDNTSSVAKRQKDDEPLPEALVNEHPRQSRSKRRKL